MAIALDQNLGTNGGGASSTINLTTTQAAASGAKIIAVAIFGTPNGTVTFSGGGLTWTTDKQYASADGGTYAIGSADAPSGLAIGSTITATCGASGNPTAIAAASFTGLAAQGSVQDGSGSTREQFNTTAWTSNSLTTVNANDLLFCLAETSGAGTPTNTAGSGWTKIHDFAVGGATSVTSEYQIVAATGTYGATGTWSLSQAASDQHEVLFAYKAGASLPPVATVPLAKLQAVQRAAYW